MFWHVAVRSGYRWQFAGLEAASIRSGAALFESRAGEARLIVYDLNKECEDERERGRPGEIRDMRCTGENHFG